MQTQQAVRHHPPPSRPSPSLFWHRIRRAMRLEELPPAEDSARNLSLPARGSGGPGLSQVGSQGQPGPPSTHRVLD